jgi:integrase
VRQVLSSILADAVDHEILDVSPAKVKGGLQYETLHEPVVLTFEQMWQLTDLMPGYLQAFVPLLATPGLRKGEMRAPMRRHLVLDDPERAVVQVRGTVVKPGRNYKFGDPKTKRSTRDIAIPSSVVPILLEHIDQYSEPDRGTSRANQHRCDSALVVSPCSDCHTRTYRTAIPVLRRTA